MSENVIIGLAILMWGGSMVIFTIVAVQIQDRLDTIIELLRKEKKCLKTGL